MSSHGAAALPSVAPGASASPTNARATASKSSARAAASRANGAKSRGPRTAEGKARASRNALKHGLCAKKFLLLPGDSRAQFAALETALLDDLSPEGALQTLLAHRLIAAAWRLFRADRLEFELFRTHDALEGGLGRALVKDGRDAKVFPTLVRYRGAAMAELFRTLEALEAVQRDAADEAEPFRTLRALEAVPTQAAAKTDAAETDVERTPGLTVVPPPAPKGAILCTEVDALRPNATRNQPERGASGHQSDMFKTPNKPEIRSSALEGDGPATPTSTEMRSPAHRGSRAGKRKEPERCSGGHPANRDRWDGPGTGHESKVDPGPETAEAWREWQ